MAKIKVKIECKHIAPLTNLNESIDAGSLKYGIFANNGSGKTFMSRMFRLTEKNDALEIQEDGKSPTDKLITRGKVAGNFAFKIIEENGEVKEDIKIDLAKGSLPVLPETNYIYHTFNQDYVEKNIKTLNFEKDSDIEGFILGKINIDLDTEEGLLKTKLEENEQLTNQVAIEISEYVEVNIKPIRDIHRIREFKSLKPQEIFKSLDSTPQEASKSMEGLISDYNKIKSVPETLAKLHLVDTLEINTEFIQSVIKDCKEEFSLSKIAEEFKAKVKSKQIFIEKGLELIENNKCSFCEQELNEEASDLIDRYNDYLQDREAVTLKRFQNYQIKLDEIKLYLKIKFEEVEKRLLEFDSYKTKYIPSLSEKSLTKIDINDLLDELNELENLIKEQQKNISISVVVNKDYVSSIEKLRTLANNTMSINNDLIKLANNKIEKTSEESLSIRREICKSGHNHLVQTHKTNFQNIVSLRNQISEIEKEIKSKKEQQKISKRDKVIETIKKVLGYFFNTKYSLDPETFRLTFNNDVLAKNEANNVLSEGEKTIVAFAYFFGDVHLKVNSEDDYSKLFFIIDDPISSMDFDHVYTLCGVLKEIKTIIDKIQRERLFVFTHNSEFMRVLSHHKIIDKRLILKNNKLSNFSINSTVPYINHLIDIYKVAKKVESPSHTTANSIRHVVETLTKFENVILEGESIRNYLHEKLPMDKRSCILINDLSHGGFRTEQSLITDDEYVLMCEDILGLVRNQFEGQIKYCEKMING